MKINNGADGLKKIKADKQEITSYQEIKHGKTLYRVTNTYKGEIELGKNKD